MRISTQDETEVDDFFFNKEYGYLATIKKYNVKPKDIHDFDEMGVRVGCPKGVEVIVPIDVKEVGG